MSINLTCEHTDRPRPHEVYTIGTHRLIRLCSECKDEWVRSPFNDEDDEPKPIRSI